MNDNTLVPFGKYRNKPVEHLIADTQYREWLLAQGWVQQRYPDLHTIIVNFGGEPQETPEHNALQLQFLDEALRAQLTGALIRPGRYPTDGRWRAKTGARWSKHHETRAATRSMERCALCLEPPAFEVDGVDVSWRVSTWTHYEDRTTYHRREGESILGGPLPSDTIERSWQLEYLRHTILVECKPTLGDDYPAALRQLLSYQPKASGHSYRILLTEQFTAKGGTLSQVKQLMQHAGVWLVLLAEARALPIPTLYPQAPLWHPPYEDLPDSST